MSIFKTKGIVLRIWKYSEKELFYKVFFSDYGILTVTKRKKAKEKPIDIGYSIACEIITHKDKSVHTFGNIKIINYFQTSWKKYKDIESFLKILQLLQQELPEWYPNLELYCIVSEMIFIQEKLNQQKLLLTRLKIISCLWNLWESHRDLTTQKILKFIHTNTYQYIMRLGNIPEETEKKLEQLL